MPTARVLQVDKPFFGTLRQVNSILTEEEMALMTPQTIATLVSNGVIEVEGMPIPGEKAGGLTATDHERIERLQASSDRTNDLLGMLIKKFDTFAAAKGKK